MLEFTRQYYQSAEIVARFDRYPDVRRAQFAFEDHLRSEFPEPSKAINQTPAASPDQPRFVLTTAKRNVVVSEVSAQLTLDFTEAPTKTDVFAVIQKYSKLLDDAVAATIPKEKLDFSGLVLKLDFAYGGDEADVSKFIFDRLGSGPINLLADLARD